VKIIYHGIYHDFTTIASELPRIRLCSPTLDIWLSVWHYWMVANSSEWEYGAAEKNRTSDPVITNDVLYH
jgi:hypothetical protein